MPAAAQISSRASRSCLLDGTHSFHFSPEACAVRWVSGLCGFEQLGKDRSVLLIHFVRREVMAFSDVVPIIVVILEQQFQIHQAIEQPSVPDTTPFHPFEI